MNKRAFTLIELLVVLTIIFLVSIFTIPAVYNALAHRQVSAGARLLQASLAGARDVAVRDNAPSGIRLLPDPVFNGLNPKTGLLDPAFPLAFNRWVPIGRPENYSNGGVSVYTDEVYPAAIRTVNLIQDVPCLVIEETVGEWIPNGNTFKWVPKEPVSWSWNIRVGDKLQISQAGPWYTVCGPMAVMSNQGNSELFINYGQPGTKSPLFRTIKSPDGLQSITVNPEFLLLVNGRDDNKNGFIDDGFDGIDNNGDGVIDDLAEWENEAWIGEFGS